MADPTDPWLDRPWRLLPNRVSRFYRGGLLIDTFRGEPHPADTDRPEDWVGSATRTTRRARGRCSRPLARSSCGRMASWVAGAA